MKGAVVPGRLARAVPALAGAAGRVLRVLPGIAGAALVSTAAWMLTPIFGLAVAGGFLLVVDWRLTR